jgi:hypothetical protein
VTATRLDILTRLDDAWPGRAYDWPHILDLMDEAGLTVDIPDPTPTEPRIEKVPWWEVEGRMVMTHMGKTVGLPSRVSKEDGQPARIWYRDGNVEEYLFAPADGMVPVLIEGTP